jgi:cytochrome c oxidase assembly protein subunit 11
MHSAPDPTEVPASPPKVAPRKGHGLIAAVCLVFVAAMVGMTYAAVPLYSIFCQVTGFGGTPRVAAAAPDKPIDRFVTVRFDGNVSNGLGWSFRPLQRSVRVKVGEAVKVAFEAENRGTRTTTGQASFNVTPDLAGSYFNKIACFCFTEQTLAPGQSVEMPVVFFVDPSIDKDHELDYVDTITLSYTFFPVAQPSAPAKPLAAASPSEPGKPL